MRAEIYSQPEREVFQISQKWIPELNPRDSPKWPCEDGFNRQNDARKYREKDSNFKTNSSKLHQIPSIQRYGDPKIEKKLFTTGKTSFSELLKMDTRDPHQLCQDERNSFNRQMTPEEHTETKIQSVIHP